MKSVLDRENELIVLKRDIEIILEKERCKCFPSYVCPRCSILRRLKELQEFKEDKKELIDCCVCKFIKTCKKEGVACCDEGERCSDEKLIIIKAIQYKKTGGIK